MLLRLFAQFQEMRFTPGVLTTNEWVPHISLVFPEIWAAEGSAEVLCSNEISVIPTEAKRSGGTCCFFCLNPI